MPGPIPQDPFERFWRQVDLSAGLLGCWPWRGACSRKASGHYRGLFQTGGRGSPLALAHRWALCLTGDGLEEYRQRPEHAAHRCNNRLCCNTYCHLYWATDEENRKDRQYHDAGGVIALPIPYWCDVCDHHGYYTAQRPRCPACGSPATFSLAHLEVA
jgi:hypothetical protein